MIVITLLLPCLALAYEEISSTGKPIKNHPGMPESSNGASCMQREHRLVDQPTLLQRSNAGSHGNKNSNYDEKWAVGAKVSWHLPFTSRGICSTWTGTLQEAKEQCDRSPSCHVLTDDDCDDKRWRYCNTSLAQLQAFAHEAGESCTMIDRSVAPERIPDAEVLFTENGRGKDSWMKQAVDDTGNLAWRRVIKRRYWMKALRCRGSSQQTCEECVGNRNCWGENSYGRSLNIVKADPQMFTRYLNVIHIRCSSMTLGIRMIIWRARYGTLRLYWDGEEIDNSQSQPWVNISGELQFPLTQHLDVFGSLKELRAQDPFLEEVANPRVTMLSISMNRPGAHEFMLEWIPNPVSGSKVQLADFNLFIPEDFAFCEDTKVCLASLSESDAGLDIRAHNSLQLECLSVPWPIVSEYGDGDSPNQWACKTWRTCLRLASPQDDPEKMTRHFLLLLDGVGVSTLTQNATVANDHSHCIDPVTEDIESWHCDCYEEMQKRCEGLNFNFTETGVGAASEADCIRAQICLVERVCPYWKELHCHDSLVTRIIDDLEGTAAMLESRTETQIFNRRDEASETLDATLQAKRCNR